MRHTHPSYYSSNAGKVPLHQQAERLSGVDLPKILGGKAKILGEKRGKK